MQLFKKAHHQPTRKPWMGMKACVWGVWVVCLPLQYLLQPHFSQKKATLLWVSHCCPQTHGRGCLFLWLPRKLLRGVGHDQAKQAWGHTGDLPCTITLFSGLACWSHLQAPATAQLKDAQWDQLWGRVWWAQKVLFSFFKSHKITKSSSISLNGTIILPDNVIELFLVTTAPDTEIVSLIFSSAYTWEQFQEFEWQLYCIHGLNILPKTWYWVTLVNFFYLFFSRTTLGWLAIMKYQNRQVVMMMTLTANLFFTQDLPKSPRNSK